MIITDQNKVEEYYQALLTKNSAYTGIFYAGVKTTAVFCIATCRARKPKKENVEFYTTVKAALKHGYRPCKICKPTENAQKLPAQVATAIKLVEANPKERISDTRLNTLNISPELVRRWFKKNYGITFHTYQRMCRINNAFKELRDGKKTTETAFEMGYESLSGFGYTYKKIMGEAPSKRTANRVIFISRITTQLGPMFACATEEGLCLLEFTECKTLEKELRDLQQKLKGKILVGENKYIKQTRKELSEYFVGQRRHFDVALHTPGTDFQLRVWNALREIPFGVTRNYQAQANSIGRPKAVRAVAAANGGNRLAIIVPCHRVIGKNGDLTGYSGGLERKKWLLEHERELMASEG